MVDNLGVLFGKGKEKCERRSCYFLNMFMEVDSCVRHDLNVSKIV